MVHTCIITQPHGIIRKLNKCWYFMDNVLFCSLYTVDEGVLMMKRTVLFALILVLFMTTLSFADSEWIIPDSDTRQLTEEELWQWDYEALCYIEYEIYARHGYRFNESSVYGAYFREQEWYTPNRRNNIDGCYAELSDLEWENVYLIAEVQDQMLSQGTMNLEEGRSLWAKEPIVPAIDFEIVSFKKKQSIPVYSAPSTKAWRGANSKAKVSTNDDIWVAGWDGDWLLIYYETSKGSVRVGYISRSKFKDDMSAQPLLEFARTTAEITEKCDMTDDITRQASSITTLSAGKQVVYLAPYYTEDGTWAYIETTVKKKTARGFVPMGCLDISIE